MPLVTQISIHAPHAGSDGRALFLQCAEGISIHAPHAGSDPTSVTVSPVAAEFQSTLPMRGATRTFAAMGFSTIHFNPRSPCGERRWAMYYLASTQEISIHAPHAGSDGLPGLLIHFRLNFNPRSPCGERPAAMYDSSPGFRFQSTLPMRGATVSFVAIYGIEVISIHAPHAGSDKTQSAASSGRSYFNPRSPCGERLTTAVLIPLTIVISIHAPHAGSDQLHNLRKGQICQDFNPRSPCGERQHLAAVFQAVAKISIHAPHAGSDSKNAQKSHSCKSIIQHFASPKQKHGGKALFFR